jgi:hypothetical protein
VWGNSPTDVYAVDGLVAHWDGSQWSPLGPASGSFNAVWSSSSKDVFAVGWNGTVVHYDGTSWTSMSAGTNWPLRAVWGSGPNDVYAVGQGGTVVHFDGTAWSPRASQTVQQLNGVWGTSPNDVIIVGAAGTILRWDGAALAPLVSPTLDDLQAIWGDSPTNVYAVGDHGTAIHYDGSAWSVIATGSADHLYGLFGASDEWVIAAGFGDSLLSLPTATIPRHGGACAGPIPVYCGSASTFVGDNRSRPAAFASYGCGARADSGPEVFHELESPITGNIIVRLTPHGADLDLIALGADAGGGCDPSKCLAASQNAGNAAEQLTLSVTQGQTYYLVVDGYNGAARDYALEVDCRKQ